MEITDLFSHKIHSSKSNWPAKLIDIASIFAEFDGKPFDRDAIENRLSTISPRISEIALDVRDLSKFRDEISAYPAYLGLYRVELINDQWYIFLSETAKKFLTCEEPNVTAYIILQLTLFQYPSGMGVAYSSKSSHLRIQKNSMVRTLNFISKNIHISPLRLICKALKADSIIRGTSLLDARVSYSEIYILANQVNINTLVNPNIDEVVKIISESRNGLLIPPAKYERRFHILNHTDLLTTNSSGGIGIRKPLNDIDANEILEKLKTINSIDIVFSGFDKVKNNTELEDEIKKGAWGRYFDAITSLDTATISILTREDPIVLTSLEYPKTPDLTNQKIAIHKASDIYQLRKFNGISIPKSNPNKLPVYADPEVTRILRQRANLSHKTLLEKLHSYLDKRGATTLENEHIDLYSQLTTQEKFVFEIKSANSDNLLSQTRRGLSQLYEYRYRYQNVIGYDVILCLVFANEPTSIDWLQEYICKDRAIGIIWFNEQDEIVCSKFCVSLAAPLIDTTQHK